MVASDEPSEFDGAATGAELEVVESVDMLVSLAEVGMDAKLVLLP